MSLKTAWEKVLLVVLLLLFLEGCAEEVSVSPPEMPPESPSVEPAPLPPSEWFGCETDEDCILYNPSWCVPCPCGISSYSSPGFIVVNQTGYNCSRPTDFKGIICPGCAAAVELAYDFTESDYVICLENRCRKKAPFKTIEMGYDSGHTERKNYVITALEDWDLLWERIEQGSEPQRELPSVDFSWEMVVAVFQGNRPTGGHSIRVSHILDLDNRLEVHISESSPGPDSTVTAGVTQPYHIIKLHNSNKKIEFIID